MNRILKTAGLIALLTFLNSCACNYNTIEPDQISYRKSRYNADSLKLGYKYDLVHSKYARKEIKKGVRLVAIEITNNTGKDLVFGRDVILTYPDGEVADVLDREFVFQELKQHPASHLLYLLLTPLTLTFDETDASGNQEEGSPIPVGYVLGPGIAGFNLLIANGANQRFKKDLLEYDLERALLENGKTTYGIIGLRLDFPEPLSLTEI